MAYVYLSNNPCKKLVGDCVIRAVSIVLNQTWQETYIDLCIIGYEMCDLPSSNAVWSAYLRDKGFKRHAILFPYDYTINDFCVDFTQGMYVVCTGTHTVAVIDGVAYDSWPSGEESPQFYFAKEK